MKSFKFFLFLTLIKVSFADDVYSVLNLFNGNYTGIVAAYGDFNADKNIDIFAISNLGAVIKIN